MSRLWGYLTQLGRKVLPPKPCKAVIEVMETGYPALRIVILGSEPIKFNG